MVRKINIVDVYVSEQEEEATQPNEQEQEEASEHDNTPEPEVSAVEEVEPSPKTKSKSNKMLDMPTTTKVLEQVSCQACGKCMSAKNLRYSHGRYCTERNQEEKPQEIPIPQIEIKNAPQIKGLKKLPVKRAKPKPQEQPPTHDPDEEPPPIEYLRIEKHEKRETPEQFWNNTIKNMKEKKLNQYKSLCSNAF